MKVVSLFQYALKAYHDGRYASIETLSKAEHCFHLVRKTRKLSGTAQKAFNKKFFERKIK